MLHSIFNFENYGELLVLVQNSIWAGAVLGLLGGLMGTFVMKRDLAFAVHGISELSFAGAAFALLIGADIILGSLAGSVLAALVLGVMGVRARDKNSIIGVIMPFGLGLGILFLSLYEGRAANKFGLLTGQIVSVGTVQLQVLAVAAVVVMLALVGIWRPLTFASVDPDVATARGVPVRALALGFMVLLGISVALSIQIVGALLVLALLITPGRGRHAGHVLAAAGGHPEHRLRDDGDRRRHTARPRRTAADQPLRDHAVIPDLCRLPRDRQRPGQTRAQRPDRADPGGVCRLGAVPYRPRVGISPLLRPARVERRDPPADCGGSFIGGEFPPSWCAEPHGGATRRLAEPCIRGTARRFRRCARPR